MKKIRLAHLYPKLLNIYGDGGNILTLKKRCEWRGIGIEIDEINIGDSIKEHDILILSAEDRIYSRLKSPENFKNIKIF